MRVVNQISHDKKRKLILTLIWNYWYTMNCIKYCNMYTVLIWLNVIKRMCFECHQSNNESQSIYRLGCGKDNVVNLDITRCSIFGLFYSLLIKVYHGNHYMNVLCDAYKDGRVPTPLLSTCSLFHEANVFFYSLILNKQSHMAKLNS